MEVLIGAATLLLGAIAASATSRSLEGSSRSRWLPVALVPPGVLVGAGAAMVRGWGFWGSVAAGGVIVPLVGIGALVFRRRRQRDHP